MMSLTPRCWKLTLSLSHCCWMRSLMSSCTYTAVIQATGVSVINFPSHDLMYSH